MRKQHQTNCLGNRRLSSNEEITFSENKKEGKMVPLFRSLGSMQIGKVKTNKKKLRNKQNRALKKKKRISRITYKSCKKRENVLEKK
jgi:hypothetical protein